MVNKTYQLRYLPLFEKDLLNAVDYIANVLPVEMMLYCRLNFSHSFD